MRLFEISLALNQTAVMVSVMNSTTCQNVASKLFAVIDSKSRAAILANIAAHYGISSEDALAEVTDQHAEHLLDYVTGSARSATSVLIQRHGL